jgi:putative heme-binding domain-containing protein
MVEAILEPSKVISDQYKAYSIATDDGKTYTGKIVSETATAYTMVINPEDASKVVDIPKSSVEEMIVSPVSLMPKDLLKQLNENEVFDLLAYLLSRGDPEHAYFK